jgi:hypothetical protein
LFIKTPPVPPDYGDYWFSPVCIKPTGLRGAIAPEPLAVSAIGLLLADYQILKNFFGNLEVSFKLSRKVRIS